MFNSTYAYYKVVRNNGISWTDAKTAAEASSFNGLTGYLASITSLAETMDIKVVAEGVENSQQLEILKERKNIVVQGYYFSKPMPLELFEEYIQNRQK